MLIGELLCRQMFIKYLNFPTLAHVWNIVNTVAARVVRELSRRSGARKLGILGPVGTYPTTIYRINFKHFVIRDLRSDGGTRSRVLFKFHFTNCTRASTHTYTSAYNRVCVHTLPRSSKRTCSATADTCIRNNKAWAGRAARGVRGKTPTGKLGGNTGSRAQAVPLALVIFPFYAFHSFVSLRMLATARCTSASVCVPLPLPLKKEEAPRYTRTRHRPEAVSPEYLGGGGHILFRRAG